MKFISRSTTGKTPVFVGLLIFGAISLFYTDTLVTRLADEERKFIRIWAKTTSELQNLDLQSDVPLTLFEIVQQNSTIPVIMVNDAGEIIGYNNLDKKKAEKKEYLVRQLREMDSQKRPIVLEFEGGQKNYIYYKESYLITLLSYYPFVQVGVVLLLILLTYLAISSSRRAEQNQVWVGMSKETAHQLGTPIQSLVAWVELLKLNEEDQDLVREVEKDVRRLETITERFSKIGSIPKLEEQKIGPIIETAVGYLKQRSSRKVIYNLHFNDVPKETTVPMNVALFEWVIENLCKNAIDAMNGAGKIVVALQKTPVGIAIEVSDTGKGIPKRKFKSVFQPGFTTKKRGWGLGLSLTKRIIEQYHNGKIYVKQSVLGKGTTFRIQMNAKLPVGINHTASSERENKQELEA